MSTYSHRIFEAKFKDGPLADGKYHLLRLDNKVISYSTQGYSRDMLYDNFVCESVCYAGKGLPNDISQSTNDYIYDKGEFLIPKEENFFNYHGSHFTYFNLDDTIQGISDIQNKIENLVQSNLQEKQFDIINGKLDALLKKTPYKAPKAIEDEYDSYPDSKEELFGVLSAVTQDYQTLNLLEDMFEYTLKNNLEYGSIRCIAWIE